MGNLVVVYGEATELESALERLARTELAEKARVIGGRAADASRGREEPFERGRGDTTRDEDGTIVAPAIAVGAGGSAGTQGTMLPYAAAAVRDDVQVPGGASQLHTMDELEDLVHGNEDEARHYERILRDGGSLLVVEGGAEDLDLAQRILAPARGQVARH
jgi:hypothetical protein